MGNLNSSVERKETINPQKEKSKKIIELLYQKYKDNPLNKEVKQNGLKGLLNENTINLLEKKIPNLSEYIKALQKNNIVIVMMGEKGLPREFVDRRFTAFVRFIKGVSDKKFIVVNEQNNARVGGLLEEAWHLVNPKGSIKIGEKFKNKYQLIDYCKTELESAVFGNIVAEVIFNEERNLKNILNKIIDIELMPHYSGKREDLLKIIFKEYKVNNIKELVIKMSL